MLQLHNVAENVLTPEEGYAPALLWNALSWYWGMSFLGMAPSYLEYINSSDPEIDAAFNADTNEDINHIYGMPRRLSIKERFDRAVNFYEYCFLQGKRTSLNPPWDYPPDIDTLIAMRQRMEGRAQKPDEFIEANVNANLGDAFRELWSAGGRVKREERAKAYNQKVLDALTYVRTEIAQRMNLSLDQLNKDTGFLDSGYVHEGCNVTVDMMDEVMPQETQLEKLGDCYLHNDAVLTYGIIGRYYTAGHNLETAMYDEDRKRELAYAHMATVRTWRKLMEIQENV